MAKEKVITVMCAARLPEILVKRVDSAAASGGVSRAQFIAEACRMRLDCGVAQLAEHAPYKCEDAGSSPALTTNAGMAEQADATDLKSVSIAGSIPAPRTKIPSQALREICAGNLTATLNDPWCGDVPPPTATEIPVCGRTWWEDGEHYECLMEKGHREQKHGLRGMSRTLEP